MLSSAGYSYDGASRLDTVTDGVNSATYGYLDNSPLVGQITFKQNGTTRMTTTKSYDFLNRLTQISSQPSADSPVSFNYAYNDANQRTSVTNADLSRWDYQNDFLGQLTNATKHWSDGTIVAGQQFQYAFDDIGNRKFAGSGGDSSGQNLRYETNTVNSVNQYTQRTVPGYANILGSADSSATVTLNNQPTSRKGEYFRGELLFDNSAGPIFPGITNVAVVNNGPGGLDIVTNATGNLFIPQAPEAFTYDADGNLTNDGHWSYVWDAENRLLNMTANANVPTPVRLKLDFAYDYQGRRISKILSTWNGSSYVAQSTTKFLYDDWNLVAELDQANALIRSYMWGLDLSGTMQRGGGVGGLLAVKIVSTAANYFAAFDGNGNVSALVDATGGAIAANYEYNPFGSMVRADGIAAAANPIRFSTKYQDDESELLYYGFRYYSVCSGRWLGRDPMGEDGDLNLYRFSLNDSVNNSDYLGQYSLNFKGKWKISERVIVMQAFDAVQSELQGFIAFIESEMQRFEDVDSNCCPYKDEWLKALRKLLVEMRMQYVDLAGSRNLDLVKKSIPGISAQALFQDNGTVPIYVIQISTAPGFNFFVQNPSENIGTIFHETSHYVFTEDDGVPETENAHTLERIFTTQPYNLEYPENAIANKYGYKAGCIKLKSKK